MDPYDALERIAAELERLCAGLPEEKAEPLKADAARLRRLLDVWRQSGDKS